MTLWGTIFSPAGRYCLCLQTHMHAGIRTYTRTCTQAHTYAQTYTHTASAISPNPKLIGLPFYKVDLVPAGAVVVAGPFSPGVMGNLPRLPLRRKVAR